MISWSERRPELQYWRNALKSSNEARGCLLSVCLHGQRGPCNHVNESHPVNRNVVEPHKSISDELTSFTATRNDEINGFDECAQRAVN